MNDRFFQLGIIGVTWSGKTFFTKLLTAYISKHQNRIIIIDDLEQFSKTEFNDFTIAYSIEEFIQAIVNKKKFKIICQFNYQEDYEKVFSIVWLLKDIILIVDELSLYCSCFELSETLRNIFQRGTKRNIRTIWNTQRPANISRNISSQTEFIISFRLSEIHDLRYFYTNRDKALKLQSLRQGEYILLRGEKTSLENIFYKFHFLLDK